jgi:hypothetical protein
LFIAPFQYRLPDPMLVCQELPGQEVSCHDPLQIRLEPMERRTLQFNMELYT